MVAIKSTKRFCGMIELTQQTIDPASVLRGVYSPAAGAAVLFVGTVRESCDGRQTACLEYEAYAAMAEKKLAELEAEARRQWPLVESRIVHRLGLLAVGEISVVIAVSAAHRREAFLATEWLIDHIKEVVPIWKKECFSDGSSEWVHPGDHDG